MERLALVSVLVNYVHFQQFLNSSQSQLSNQQLLPNTDLTELLVEATKQYLAISVTTSQPSISVMINKDKIFPYNKPQRKQ